MRLYVREKALLVFQRARLPPTNTPSANTHARALVGYMYRDGAGSQIKLITRKIILKERNNSGEDYRE